MAAQEDTEITWESFTLIYVMAAFTWLGITILQACVESYSNWHQQVEGLKEKQKQLDDQLQKLLHQSHISIPAVEVVELVTGGARPPPPPPPPPLPPPPSFNNKLVISKKPKDKEDQNNKKVNEEKPPVMHYLLEELSRKAKDRPKITGIYQSPRTLRLSNAANTHHNKRLYSGGGVSLANSMDSSKSPAKARIFDVDYIGDSLRRRFAKAYPDDLFSEDDEQIQAVEESVNPEEFNDRDLESGEEEGTSEGEGEDLESGEEDEEEEDDEEGLRPAKKKHKKSSQKRNIFIDDLARVDDDEDDEDEGDAEDGFEYADEAPEIEQNYRDTRRFRELDNRERLGAEEEAEAIAKRLEDKYGRAAGFGEFRGDIEHVPQHMLIPSVNDPKIWMVKCKPGSEKAIVFAMCRKFLSMETSKKPLHILSCFCRDSLKGYIYLEAERQAHVVEAIERMNNIYGSKLLLVPVSEMVDCLRVKAKEIELKLMMWVRIKRGKYAGDLGQVVEIFESGDKATIKLIPRLDYSKDATTKRKKGSTEIRPPQKLFNANDVNKREVQTIQGGFMYQQDQYDKDGYLEKEFKTSNIEYKSVNPKLEEITRFNGGAVEQGEELSMLASTNIAKASDFQTGEKVVVLSGEMKNVEGVVASVENGIVNIIPDSSYGLKNNVHAAASDLAKRFVDGDHAKVINGVHKDESGLVIKVENNIVTMLSDTSLKPIEVFSKDLRAAIEVTSITPSTSQYDLHDLVQLSPNELGVIVKMEKDTITLLDPFGSIVKVKLQQIRNRRDSARAVTSDMNGRPITAKDTVMVMDDTGGNRRQAEILHVYRTFVFLHSRNVVENGGVFVTKNTNVAMMSAQGIGNGGANFNQPRIVSAPSRGRMNNRDPLLSKTVTITGGPFKGYLGIVKDTTESHARVELHTNSRTVNVEKDKLNIQGETNHHKQPDYHASSRPSYNRYENSRTPMHVGSKTPAYEGGSSWNAGGRTPAWDSGSKTPAWDSGSKTPAWEAAKTPGVYGRGATPRVTGTPSATTPYHGAPTPGFPATPGVSNTPYARSAPTPATPYDPASVNHPQTPAGGFGEYARNAEISGKGSWITVDIEVLINSQRRFSAGKLDGQEGVIQIVDGNRAQIQLLSTGETVMITEDFLKPVAPSKKDTFKVLMGEDKGKIGTLLSIDGHEGVVKIDGVDDILMMNMDTLAKLHT